MNSAADHGEVEPRRDSSLPRFCIIVEVSSSQRVEVDMKMLA